MVETAPRRVPVLRAVWRLIRFVFDRVIRDPIAAGRLKDEGWPLGLKGIAVVWAVLYTALMAAAAFSTVLRSNSPLLYDGQWVTLPAVALPLVTVAFIFGLTCLYVAGLHLVWWLRLPITLVVVAFLLRLADYGPSRWPVIALLVAAALLVVLLAIRWGRPFHWLEFVAALFVIGHGVLLAVIIAPQAYAGYAIDHRVNALVLIAGFAWCLAIPAGLVAGAAMTELTVSFVAWTVTGIWQELGSRRRWAPAWGIVAVTLLALLRAGQIGWHVWHDDPEYEPAAALPSMGILVLVLAGCALIVRRADRVPGGDPPLRPDPDDVIARWSTWSMVLAVLLSVALGGALLVSNVLDAFWLDEVGEIVEDLGGGWQFTGLVLLGAVVGLVVAFVLSGRGQRVVPVMLTAASVWWIGMALPDQLNLHASQAGVGIGATVVALGVFGWLLVRRRLTAVRAVALSTVLVLAGVFEYRDVLDEPLTAAFSLVGISAAVLVGLVWRMLTDSAYSRRDSRRFPRPSRVLIALASTIYAVTSIALTTLIGGYLPYDFNLLETSGDITLGFSLVCVAFFAGLSLAARGRLVRPDPPRDDYGKLLAPGAAPRA